MNVAHDDWSRAPKAALSLCTLSFVCAGCQRSPQAAKSNTVAIASTVTLTGVSQHRYRLYCNTVQRPSPAAARRACLLLTVEYIIVTCTRWCHITVSFQGCLVSTDKSTEDLLDYGIPCSEIGRQRGIIARSRLRVTSRIRPIPAAIRPTRITLLYPFCRRRTPSSRTAL